MKLTNGERAFELPAGVALSPHSSLVIHIHDLISSDKLAVVDFVREAIGFGALKRAARRGRGALGYTTERRYRICKGWVVVA